jgi:hypothetical protein
MLKIQKKLVFIAFKAPLIYESNKFIFYFCLHIRQYRHVIEMELTL